MDNHVPRLLSAFQVRAIVCIDGRAIQTAWGKYSFGRDFGGPFHAGHLETGTTADSYSC
jgi:hypothetical protein